MEKNINYIKNPEIQNYVEKIDNAAKETENIINEDIKNLRDFIRFLKYDQECLNRIEEENRWAQKDKETATECGIGYKEKDIEIVKRNIEKTQSTIKRIEERIKKLSSYNTSFNTQVEELKNLEEQFKKIILKINPEQLQ